MLNISLSCFGQLGQLTKTCEFLQEGLARLEKRKKWERPEKQTVLDELETYQTEARKYRLGMWEYGDIQSDEEDNAPPLRKAVGKK